MVREGGHLFYNIDSGHAPDPPFGSRTAILPELPGAR
jgi:hypothetical protein